MDDIISAKGAFGEWAEPTDGDRVTAALILLEMGFLGPHMGVEPTLTTPPAQTPALAAADIDPALAFARQHWRTMALVALAGVAVGGWCFVLAKPLVAGAVVKHAASLLAATL